MSKYNIIYLIHKDWEGECIIDKNNIIRKDYPEENGTFIIKKNILTINWKKWGEETFLCGEDLKRFYVKLLYEQLYNIFYIFDNKDIINIVINNQNNNFIIYGKQIIFGKYKMEENALFLEFNHNINIYKKIYNKIYIPKDDDIYIIIELIDYNINLYEYYIFNKIDKIFYNAENIDISGKYEIIDNYIILNFSDGNKKKFKSDKYKLENNINTSNTSKNQNISNIKIIKSKSIIIDDRILFSNISLCNNKIICTSIHYRDCPWDINDIILYTKDCNIINKKIYDHDNFESVLSIILELDTIPSNVSLFIGYKNSNYNKFNLKQLNIKKHNLSAMTLFKDDYYLLKRYLKYYNNLGIDIFFLYYNGIITETLINNIIKLNDLNLNIYIVEWDYKYWWNYIDLKHHHSQTMAINDSLHILKEYGNYTLYNDLDEYIILKDSNNFIDLISKNKDIDCFIFKNRFCKMSDSLISYENFDNEFDLNRIIKGNYWNKEREKNLIKLKNINVMGVHQYYNYFNNILTYNLEVSEFYHIINFIEKNREDLMTEYKIIL
jgi:hypothetical protein